MDGSTHSTATPFANLSSEELEDQITEIAGHLNAANHRWLSLIAEFDRRQRWAEGVLQSCAHWLNFKEVRALTRVATAATEDALLMIALHGTANHVETVVRYFRQVSEAAALSHDSQQQAGRTVDYWYDTDGSLVLKARLPSLPGALLIKALEAALVTVPATEVNVQIPQEDRLSIQARRANALAMIADTYLQHESAAVSTADRHQVVIHVDAETLREQAPGRCHVEHGPAPPVTTVRRLTCDVSLVRITENEDGEPRDVGRKTRTIPPAIRRALHARDVGCCFPGCTYRRYLDAHHIEHWADGGWRFRRPDGREFELLRRSPAPVHTWTSLYDANAAGNIVIDATTAATRWTGERMDYEMGVSNLCALAGVPDPIYPEWHAGLAMAARGVSAETSRSVTNATCEYIDDEHCWRDGQRWRRYDGKNSILNKKSAALALRETRPKVRRP